MKKTFCILGIILGIIISCTSSKKIVSAEKNSIPKTQDTIKIANEKLEYEVIIIEPGFNSWLNSNAHPRGYYNQSYLEAKNQLYISEWNRRVLQPLKYDRNLYEMTIDYNPNIDYGYEVNYLIYNYMIYFQNKYRQRLSGYVPLR